MSRTTDKFEYTPIGDEISVESAFTQAAGVLDMAAKFAVESRDQESLQNLSVLWMELGARLANGGLPVNYEEGHPEEEEEMDEGRPIGFTAELGDSKCQN